MARVAPSHDGKDMDAGARLRDLRDLRNAARQPKSTTAPVAAKAAPSRCRRIWLSFVDADCDGDVDWNDAEAVSSARLAEHFFSGRGMDRRFQRQLRSESRRPRQRGPLDGEEAQPQVHRNALIMFASKVTGKVIEDRDDYWPIFVILEALLTFILWVIGATSEEEFFSAKAGLDSIFPGRTNMATHQDCADLRFQVWRWLTYQFSHSGLSHLGLNIFMLLVVGIRLERYHGHWRTLVIFNLGVICAAFNFAVIDGHASLIGMSGGVYALMGMTFGSLILNWHDTRYRRPELFMLVLLFLLDLAFAYFDSTSADSETSHSAHFGGYAAGVILGVLVGRNLDEEEQIQHAKTLRCERFLQGIFASTGAVALLLVFAWMAQWPPRTLSDTTPWCWNRQVFNQSMFPDEFRYHCVRCQDQQCISMFEAMPNTEKVSFRICQQAGWSYSQ